jgi:DNA-binding MarR family transcriptional regulator
MLAGQGPLEPASLTAQRDWPYDLGTVPATTTRAPRDSKPLAPADSGAGPLTARDARLAPWRAFVRAQAHVSRRLDEDLRNEHGLSLQEYVALLILAEAPERRLRMGRLADSLTLSKSGATRLIDRLADDGFVARVSCSSDLRGAEAALTEAGLDRLRTAAPTHLRGIADYFLSAIDHGDLEVVERTMLEVADRACGTKDRA